MEITKVCIKCNAVKSIDEFYKQKASKDGYQISCKSCVLTRGKELRKRYSKLQLHEIEFKERKICCYCKVEKKIEEFSKDKTIKDGYSNKCKLCQYYRNKKYIIFKIEKE